MKTSLAPGSRVVTDYFEKAGLTKPLEALGFYTVGYGCTTCIGNSGPLPEPVAKAVTDGDLVAAAVLSGNRNFEGRINPLVKANYLASPPLVVAYALAGTTDIDWRTEPLGKGSDGKDVYLKDIWPTHEEVAEDDRRVRAARDVPEAVRQRLDGEREVERSCPTSEGELYEWDPDSTYIQEPPFLVDLARRSRRRFSRSRQRACWRRWAIRSRPITFRRPARSRPKSPAGKYLIEHGVEPRDFNSYGARRGNDRVMTRGTFANIRIRNLLGARHRRGRHAPSARRRRDDASTTRR